VGWSKPVEGYNGEPEVVDRSEAPMRGSDVGKELTCLIAAFAEGDEGCSAVWLREACQG